MKAEKLIKGLQERADRVINRLASVGYSDEAMVSELEGFAKMVKGDLTEFLVENTQTPKGSFNIWDFTAQKKEAVVRPGLSGVYYDAEGYRVATDAMVLVVEQCEVSEEQAGKIFNKKGEVIEARFPNWRGVMPKDMTEGLDVEVRPDLADAIKRCKVGKESESIAFTSDLGGIVMTRDYWGGTQEHKVGLSLHTAKILQSLDGLGLKWKFRNRNSQFFGVSADGKLQVIIMVHNFADGSKVY